MKYPVFLATIMVSFLVASCAMKPTTDAAPVSTHKSTISMHVPDTFDRIGDWRQVIDTLETTKAKKVILYWNGGGGYLYVGNRVKQAMNTAKVRGVQVIVRVNYYSASMHAVLVCSASKIEKDPRSGVLMFHLGASSSGGGVHLDAAGRSELRRVLAPCIARGIVSSSDVVKIGQGYELILYPSGKKVFKKDKRL